MSLTHICQCLLLTVSVPLLTESASAAPEGLESYLQAKDSAFAWKRISKKDSGDFTIVRVKMISQKWRGTNWTHEMIIVRPKVVRSSDIGFMLVGGSESPRSHLGSLKLLAERAGAVTAYISEVPNQPLMDGLAEDALIAHTFDQFLRTGDATWPVLFPMVKSAVRGLDTIAAVAQNEFGQKIERFVVSGASKRGWTTWLTAAVDPRVAGIAPMVFDMLNMKAQTAWTDKVYGHQSEMIHDYTDKDLVQRIDKPRMKQLRNWVDPYAYRSRYNMPKLILLGTNDPYWTVDSLRHYWNDLPEPKLIYQTPNAGHNLDGGEEAINTMAAFFEMIAAGAPLPQMDWKFTTARSGEQIRVDINQSASIANLWTADSSDRDFRKDRWSKRSLKIKPGSAHTVAVIERPAKGYRAMLVEAQLKSPSGHPYRLSTEVKVIPDLP